VVLPGAAYVELALAAGAEGLAGAPFELCDVELERMLALPLNGAGVPLQVALTIEGDSGTVQVSSYEGKWHRHARATVRQVERRSARRVDEPETARARCRKAVGATQLYPQLARRGLGYGPHFQGVEEVWLGDGEVLGRVRLPESLSGSCWHLHPALLDACLQSTVALIDEVAGQGGAVVPVSLERVRLHRPPGTEVWVHGRLRRGEGSGLDAVAVDLTLMDDRGEVIAEVGGLRLRGIAKSKVPGQDPVAEWLYTLSWRRIDWPAAKAPSGGAKGSGTWLVLADGSGVAETLASLMEADGERCVVVRPGGEALPTVLRTVFPEGTPCRGVVHLWSLDTRTADPPTAEGFDADLGRGCLSALELAQAMVQNGWREAPRLWLVTRGAQAVGGEKQIAVSQAALWGLGRVLSLEHTELVCVGVDLPPEPSAGDAQALFDELHASDGEQQVALRAEARFAARLVRLPAPVLTESADLRGDGTYLVTGGLGGLGLSVAGWLVARGARHVVLVGRSGASEAAEKAITALEARGARVDVVRADVSRRDDVARVLSGISRLRGVVHAAGVLADATVLTLDARRFREVMGAKVHGALHLHELTRGQPLDFFVLYASAAGLLGSPGQGNYASANVTLDALAHHRRAQGLPALSLDWGAFSEVGLAAAEDNRGARLGARGMESLTPDEGLLALKHVWSGTAAQVGAFKLDLRRWVQSYPAAAGSSLLHELWREAERTRPPASARGRLRAELGEADPAARAAMLERHLASVLGQVLRLPAAQIERQTLFKQYGLDSLMSLEVRNRLEVDLGERLSAALLLNYPTLATLSEHLMSRLGHSVSPEKPVPRPARASLAGTTETDLSQLSNAELARLTETFL
jgi:acyl carrier protein